MMACIGEREWSKRREGREREGGGMVEGRRCNGREERGEVRDEERWMWVREGMDMGRKRLDRKKSDK